MIALTDVTKTYPGGQDHTLTALRDITLWAVSSFVDSFCVDQAAVAV